MSEERICNEDDWSFEEKEKEALEIELYELKNSKKENLFVSRHDRAIDYSRCLVCGATGFNTLSDLVLHYGELHEQKLGITYTEFVQRYPSLVKKMLERANKETAKRLQLDFDAEMFQRALRTPLPERDDLAQKFTMPLIRKEFEELTHSIYEQKTCPACNMTEPILDSENRVTIETIEEHMKRMHSEEWKRYVNLGKASKGNLQALSEKEELSKNTPLKQNVNSHLVEATTEKSEELLEELSKPKKELPNLVKIFGKEILEELSSKKSKGKRKTKVPNSTDIEE